MSFLQNPAITEEGDFTDDINEFSAEHQLPEVPGLDLALVTAKLHSVFAHYACFTDRGHVLKNAKFMRFAAEARISDHRLGRA